MPDTRKNKTRSRKNDTSNLMSGGEPPENTIKTSRLLIVNNALEAVTLAGANLFAAPEWVVVCNSGGKDGGEALFYKTMSMMGVYDYHYGFGENYGLLRDLAKSDWCLIATTDTDIELTQVIREIFNQEPTIIAVHDNKLPDKLNRFKTVLTKHIETMFQKEESQTIIQQGGVLDSGVVHSIQEKLRPNVYAEFLTRESFTVSQILKKMNTPVEVIEGDKKFTTFSHILYLPETSTDKNIEILQSRLPNTMNMDMLFFDNRPQPVVVAEQYFYSIDLSQPIIIRTSDKTRNFIALLDKIDDLVEIFKQGYQFLSTMRIGPLGEFTVVQQGGQFDQDSEEFGFEEDEYSQFASNPLDTLFGIIKTPTEVPVEQQEPVVGGGRKSRKTLKRRKAL